MSYRRSGSGRSIATRAAAGTRDTEVAGPGVAGQHASPLVRWGRWLVAQPGRVAAVVVLGALLAGFLGSLGLGSMSAEVGDPDAPSQQAIDQITQASDTSVSPDDIVALVALPDDWGTAAATREVRVVANLLGDVPGVVEVVSPRDLPPPAVAQSGLLSRDGRSALVTAGIDARESSSDVATAVDEALAVQIDDGSVSVGGAAEVDRDIDERIGADLARAEIFAFPILLVLGIWIFRGVVAAVVPLAVGALAIALTIGGLGLVGTQLVLSEYVLNLVLGLGLGLAIDYCLFIISRYREEILVDGYGRAAVVRTLVAAGHTVLFSATIVALAMSTLMLFPQRFLYSMGIGGVLVTLMAALVSVTLLPALLVLLGHRIDSLTLPVWRRARERESADASAGRWYHLSRWTMRLAVTVFPLGLLLALLIALPATQTSFSDVDETSLPTSSSARQVSQVVKDDFPRGDWSTIVLAVDAGPGDDVAVQRLQDQAADAVQRNVVTDDPPRYLGDDTWVVTLDLIADTYDPAATSAVEQVRSVDSDLPFLVGGATASFLDLESSMASYLPWALLIVSVAVLLVMFTLTGSLVLSIKTLLLTALNVAMTFGVLVWIFQYGNLEWLFGFESTGRIDLLQPTLVAIIAFGLSTDYGVFLFARIMEAHDEGREDLEAVALGVGRSGRIISSAALLLCVAIGAFSTSSILFIKQLGVGAAVSVFLDATLIRAVLVPSAMQLMGAANWWSPRWLAALTPRGRRLQRAETADAPSPTRVLVPAGASAPVPIPAAGRRPAPPAPDVPTPRVPSVARTATRPALVDELGLEPRPGGGWRRPIWHSGDAPEAEPAAVRAAAATVETVLFARGESAAWQRSETAELWLLQRGRLEVELGGFDDAPRSGHGRVVLGVSGPGTSGRVAHAAGAWWRLAAPSGDVLLACVRSATGEDGEVDRTDRTEPPGASEVDEPVEPRSTLPPESRWNRARDGRAGKPARTS